MQFHRRGHSRRHRHRCYWVEGRRGTPDSVGSTSFLHAMIPNGLCIPAERQGRRALNHRIGKKVLEEVMILSPRHLQGRAANLAVHPGHGTHLHCILVTFSLDESLELHQRGGDRSHVWGVLAAIDGSARTLWAQTPQWRRSRPLPSRTLHSRGIHRTIGTAWPGAIARPARDIEGALKAH